MVESRSMVNGPSPGPAPAAQARASNSRLTRSNWRTWPHRKLRSNCLFGQVVGLGPARFQGVAVLIMALQMVSSLRMHAVRATLGAFPAARSRWSKARIVGLYCVATKVAMYSRCHVQYRPQLSPTSPHSALPPHGPAVPIVGSHAHQSGDLLVAGLPPGRPWWAA